MPAASSPVLRHAPAPPHRAMPDPVAVASGCGVFCLVLFLSAILGDAFLTRYGRIVGLDASALQGANAEYGKTWTVFPAVDPMHNLLDGLSG